MIQVGLLCLDTVTGRLSRADTGAAVFVPRHQPRRLVDLLMAASGSRMPTSKLSEALGNWFDYEGHTVHGAAKIARKALVGLASIEGHCKRGYRIVPWVPKPPKQRVAEVVIELLYAGFARGDLTLAVAADAVGLSPKQIHRRFQAYEDRLRLQERARPASPPSDQARRSPAATSDIAA